MGRLPNLCKCYCGEKGIAYNTHVPDSCSHRDISCKTCGAEGIHFLTAQPKPEPAHVEVHYEQAPRKGRPFVTGILLALATIVLLDAFGVTRILANFQYVLPQLQYLLSMIR